MQADNPTLACCTAGPRHDFDYNLDGLAHFGLLPDFLQDMRTCGLTPEDLAPLFRCDRDYVRMWETCAQKSNMDASPV